MTDPGASIDLDAHLAGLDRDLAALRLDTAEITHSDALQVPANWKYGLDTFFETYHLNVAAPRDVQGLLLADQRVRHVRAASSLHLCPAWPQRVGRHARKRVAARPDPAAVFPVSQHHPFGRLDQLERMVVNMHQILPSSVGHFVSRLSYLRGGRDSFARTPGRDRPGLFGRPPGAGQRGLFGCRRKLVGLPALPPGTKMPTGRQETGVQNFHANVMRLIRATVSEARRTGRLLRWPDRTARSGRRSVAQVVRLRNTRRVSAAGVPIDTPVLYFPSEGLRSIDLATGLSYPAKAERARRNPKVGLWIEGGPDEPVISIAGMAAVRDTDLQANVDRYLSESAYTLPTIRTGRWPARRCGTGPASWSRSCRRASCGGTVRRPWTGRRTAGMLRRTPSIRSPIRPRRARPARPPGGSSSPGRSWPGRPLIGARRGMLSVIDGEGFPRPVRADRRYHDRQRLAFGVPAGLPWDMTGKACLTFGGIETFVGDVASGADGRVLDGRRADLAGVPDDPGHDPVVGADRRHARAVDAPAARGDAAARSADSGHRASAARADRGLQAPHAPPGVAFRAGAIEGGQP